LAAAAAAAAGAGEGYGHFAGTDGSKSFITGGVHASTGIFIV
jgi:hypothetical protein